MPPAWKQQGISLELYLQYMQMSTDKLREDLKEAAVTQIKQQLALDAVVAAEEIVVSDEDVEEEVKKAAANLNVPYERVTEGLDREALKVDLARDRAWPLWLWLQAQPDRGGCRRRGDQAHRSDQG